MSTGIFSKEMAFAAVTSLGLHAVWMVSEAKAKSLPPTRPAEVILEAYQAPAPAKIDVPETEPEVKPSVNQKLEPVTQKSVAKVASAVAPPPAAEAGKTLTAPDEANGDLADFTMVQGNGAEYRGGTTSAIGTSQQAVHGAASDRPREPIVASRVAAPSVVSDASERPRPLGNDWNCSRLFPSDPEAGDAATVSIVVAVGLDGTAKSVTVLRDPGHGFGAAARACAMTQRFSVGRDRLGQPVAATTPPITVRFTR